MFSSDPAWHSVLYTVWTKPNGDLYQMGARTIHPRIFGHPRWWDLAEPGRSAQIYRTQINGGNLLPVVMIPPGTYE